MMRFILGALVGLFALCGVVHAEPVRAVDVAHLVAIAQQHDEQPTIEVGRAEKTVEVAQLSGGLQFPGPGTAHSTGGGGSTTITMTSASAQHGGFGPLSSFSMAVGSYNAATDDLIFFGGDEQGSNFGSSVTIGGVVATQRAVNADNKTAVWSISRGSGVSVSGGNVTVTLAGTVFGACAFAIGYSTGNASSTPTSANTTAFAFFASPNQISGTVASGGAGAVFNWDNGTAGLPFTWLPAGWARVAATETSQATGNGTQTGSAVQGTPAANTYNLDNQRTSGGYAFIAFQ